MVYKTMGVHKGTSFQQVIGENTWKPRRSNVFVVFMIAPKEKKNDSPKSTHKSSMDVPHVFPATRPL